MKQLTFVKTVANDIRIAQLIQITSDRIDIMVLMKTTTEN